MNREYLVIAEIEPRSSEHLRFFSLEELNNYLVQFKKGQEDYNPDNYFQVFELVPNGNHFEVDGENV